MMRRAFGRLTLAAGAGLLAFASLPGTARAYDPAPVPPIDPLPAELLSALADPPSTPAGKASGWVVAGDQGGHQIVVLDARRREWAPDRDPRALKWSWAPTAEAGYADVLTGWGAVSDVRVRMAGGKAHILAGDGLGFIGAVEFPSGNRRWAIDAGRQSNVHAAELLPNGNVAAAASRGAWIRVYAASQGPAATAYTEFKLKGGHGVLWDPRREVLWATGDEDLVTLKVGGTAEAPTLTEIDRVALPSVGGHDLAPVYGDRNRLWVTTNFGVYQYDKTTKTFTTEYRYSASVNIPIVKAIGDHPLTRQVLLTRPKQGCATVWCTDTAEFFGKGAWNATRTLPSAQFYKARWFVPAYQ